MPTMRDRHLLLARALLLLLFSLSICGADTFAAEQPRVFRAGAFAIDVTPTNFPVIVNGGFLSKFATKANDRLHMRWLVLDDGQNRVALGVFDSCLIPRDFADEVKTRAQKLTGIRLDRIMLSATHTHSAPSLMTCLGTDADPHYPAFVIPKIVEGLKRAVDNLAPARIGWAVTEAPEHTHTRVWIRRPDRMKEDPFGALTGRAHMHPGHLSPEAIGPSGPTDPELMLLAVQSPDGRPVAVLANYAMHYFGAAAVSADYYGIFVDKLGQMIGAPEGFVGIMSQGCSGDQHWMDYGKPRPAITIQTYAEEVARIAFAAWITVRYHDWVPLAMHEKDIRLATRQPDAKRLAWAREVMGKLNDRQPKTIPEVYAREQLWLKANPTRPVKLQALRVGDLGIAMWPCEVFAISGLKVKAQSPFRQTMNIELANAEEGYIPPPELHPLGGYNTWPCRTAGLEANAEPRIVDHLLSMLEKVSGEPRRKVVVSNGPYAQAVLAAKPVAYWRLEEWSGTTALSANGSRQGIAIKPGVAPWLEGPQSQAFSGTGSINRCLHIAGGHLSTTLKLGDSYTAELWFWKGVPENGCLLELGTDSLSVADDKVVLGGLTGRKTISQKSWHHVALVRDGERVAVYLDGDPACEIAGNIPPTARGPRQLTLGKGLEGKIDEVAIYNQSLSSEEIRRHYQIAGEIK